VVAKLNIYDVRVLVRLVTDEMDRMAKTKEKYSFYDSGYSDHLADIRNKLLALPLDEELASTAGDKEWQKLPGGRRGK